MYNELGRKSQLLSLEIISATLWVEFSSRAKFKIFTTEYSPSVTSTHHNRYTLTVGPADYQRISNLSSCMVNILKKLIQILIENNKTLI